MGVFQAHFEIYMPVNYTFDQAQEHCALFGLDLISLHSEYVSFLLNAFEETHHLSRILYSLKPPGQSPFYIGLHYESQLQNWTWTDGSELDFVNFLNGLNAL